MNPSAAIIEAVAALSAASAVLELLERPDLAHRCDSAAAQIQLVFVAGLEQLDDDEG